MTVYENVHVLIQFLQIKVYVYCYIQGRHTESDMYNVFRLLSYFVQSLLKVLDLEVELAGHICHGYTGLLRGNPLIYIFNALNKFLSNWILTHYNIMLLLSML